MGGMAKRQRKPKASTGDTPTDPAPECDGKDPAAVALGRKGGLKGGPARAAKLTKEQRSESARKAARARWAKQSGQAGGASPASSG
jgi:hypothetical protein